MVPPVCSRQEVCTVASGSAWLRLNADIFTNPKIEALSMPAALLYIAGLCEAKSVNLGGLIPQSSVERVALPLKNRKFRGFVSELVEAGLWLEVEVEKGSKPKGNPNETQSNVNATFEQNGLNVERTDPKPGRYYAVHDWAEYQQSAGEISKNAERQARFRENQKRKAEQMPLEGNGESNVTRDVTSNVTSRSYKYKDKDNNVTRNANENDSSTEIVGRDAPTAEPISADSKRRGKQKASATIIPEDWQPPAGMQEWAERELGIAGADFTRELGQYRDHFRHHGEPRSDHAAGFRNWLRREAKSRAGLGFRSGRVPVATVSGSAQNGRAYKTSNDRLAEIAAGK